MALKRSSVAVFGLGGVGSYAAEALARCGVGRLALIDGDKVDVTNINRQLIATVKTVGQPKAEAARERILSVNPGAEVTAHTLFYGGETADQIQLSGYDYIVDAIDTISSKLLLIERAALSDTPVISCMGAGNKLDPARFEVADIYDTSVCPLARVMRRELRARGVEKLKVVYSKEPPITLCAGEAGESGRVPGSVSFVPSAAGLIMASEVVKDIIKAARKEWNA
jgi:tRNA A37 threonylcarbamoyladenosine dehydratase